MSALGFGGAGRGKGWLFKDPEIQMALTNREKDESGYDGEGI